MWRDAKRRCVEEVALMHLGTICMFGFITFHYLFFSLSSFRFATFLNICDLINPVPGAFPFPLLFITSFFRRDVTGVVPARA